MGLLIITCFLLGPLALLFFMRRWLQQNGAGRAVRSVFGVAMALGLVLGLWLSLRFEYEINYASGARRKVAGAPLPIVVFSLEDGHWTDFPPPFPMIILLVMTNAAISSAGLAGPVVLGFVLRRQLTPRHA